MTMDARILRHTDHVPSVLIPTERLIDLSVDTDMLRAYIKAASEAGGEPSTSALQLCYQKALCLKNAPAAPIDPERLKVQHQPPRSLPVYAASPVQTQWTTATISLTPEQRAENKKISQRQYAAQMRQLAAIQAAEMAETPALAA